MPKQTVLWTEIAAKLAQIDPDFEQSGHVTELETKIGLSKRCLQNAKYKGFLTKGLYAKIEAYVNGRSQQSNGAEIGKHSISLAATPTLKFANPSPIQTPMDLQMVHTIKALETLEIVFDGRKFDPGESDATVAKATGLSESFIRRVRESKHGPLIDDEIQVLKHSLESLEAQIATLRTKVESLEAKRKF